MEQGPEPEPYSDILNLIEAKLDPNHTLPAVEFVKSTRNDDFPSESRQIMHDEQQVGVFNLEFDHNFKVGWIRTILINDAKRRQGLGLATYLEVIKEMQAIGYSFRTSPSSQTTDAKSIWEQLESAGIARVDKEFEFNNQLNKFEGIYVIPAPTQS